MPNFSSLICCLQTSQCFNTADYHVRLQRNVFITQTFHSIDELKHWLIQVWCNLDYNITDMAIDHWCKPLSS